MTRSVRIVNETGVSTGTKVFDLTTGAEIGSLTKIALHEIEPNSILKADLTVCFAQIDVQAEATVYATFTKDGRETRRAVKSITFADGETVEF